MNEFVTLCARDRIPLIWLQDTTGIDVGDDAEKAELLGLGQSLIYSIENSGLPSLEVTLRTVSYTHLFIILAASEQRIRFSAWPGSQVPAIFLLSDAIT